MAATTKTKKDIVDFLWDWASKEGKWAEFLIDRIVALESPLLDAERKKTFDFFLQSINLKQGTPGITIAKPTYRSAAKNILLTSLCNVSGVNRLCKGQTLDFSKNITIVYGENGTGKTGYGRILKALGFSYDASRVIYHNVYGTKEAQAATINYEVNGTAGQFIWDGKNDHPDLRNISVFNNSCVQISLQSRNLIVSPIGFHLFNLVSAELNALAKMLNELVAKHPTTAIWFDLLHEGTLQHGFITRMTASSSIEKLNELASFTEADALTLQTRQANLSKLNKAFLEREIQVLIPQITELTALLARLDETEKQLTVSVFEQLQKLEAQRLELEKKAQKGINEVASEKGIQLYESKEFKEFLSSAETYIQKLGTEYPADKDVCIYCRQSLDSASKELLSKYRQLLNDTSQEDLKTIAKQKETIIKKLQVLQLRLHLNQSSFGADEDGNAVQPAELTTYNDLIEKWRTKVIEVKPGEASPAAFEFGSYRDLLANKKQQLERDKENLTNRIKDISTEEAELVQGINELLDRKLLSGKAEEINTLIRNRIIVAKLQSSSGSFNTYAISRKTTEAREALVQQNFNDTFQQELKAFRKGNININLSFGTDKGKSKVNQTINNHLLIDILSEGEQKAIALAEFLTELQLDDTLAPVIFDDPVNSLDHRIIDEVAKRLAELSTKRQVIVFTHSILLLNSFLQQHKLAMNANMFKFHKVTSDFGETGILDEVEEVNSYGYYTKKLQAVLDTKPGERKEEKLASEGYGHLRSAIEVCVEQDILQNTIVRYGKGVAFPSLIRVDGTKLEQHKRKLNDIYEKCCTSIVGHSSAGTVHTTPTMNELKGDYAEFQKIRKEFK